MKYLTIAVIAAAISMGSATCPNLCNGHGECTFSDRCDCFGNWQGADCSERVCSYGLAWVDAPSATNTAHWYAECSNKGVCDRTTGLCDCYEGYTGKGCRRSTCPNDCSGHGTCYYIEQLSTLDSKFIVDYDNMQTYTNWDASKIQACVCDPYFEGTDCSLRQCPRGDNILTLNEYATVQQLQISHDDTSTSNSLNLSGEIIITFTDLYGGTWTTRPITVSTTEATFAANIAAALKALPNQVIEDISCGAGGTVGSGLGVSMRCTFTSDHNAGAQNLLKIHQTGCNRAGCTPKYTGVDPGNSGDFMQSPSVTDVTSSTGNHKEKTICSEHGLCDTETGLCNCFSGYYDEDCSKQTVLV